MNCGARLPRHTALPPLLFVSVCRHDSQPQTAEANLIDIRPSGGASITAISRSDVIKGVYIYSSSDKDRFPS
ncbi:MAG: hypothetical protein MR784_08280 [Rikenellaceae bacterium]|nr:hypothetical protein [Rikenellaceae bacterium]